MRSAKQHAHAVSAAFLASILAGCAGPSGTQTEFSPPGASSPFREKGAPWTILCLELRGPYGEQNIDQFADSLRGTRGMNSKQVFVRHNVDDVSRLYHGIYYRLTDPKTNRRSTPEKLKRQVAAIKELVGPRGERYFIGARMVRWPYPNVGNPDWRLSDIDGTYSLQVAVFEPTDDVWDIKGAASEYCRELRDHGFEAYYHHGDGASMVTVGVFGDDAVIPRVQGLPLYSARVSRLQQQDELMMYNRLNGAVYTAKSQTGEKVRVRSRLVRIPKLDDTPW